MAAGNLDRLKVVKELPRREIVLAAARLPATARLFFGGSDFKVYEIDLAQAKPEARELGSHTSYVTGIALAGPWVISGSYDGRLIWWDREQHSQVRAVDAHAKWIRAVAATRDGKTVASVADDMVCRVWDVETGKMRHELRGHKEMTPHHFPSMLYTCAISPDGRYLATGDRVGHVAVWDLASGQPLTTLEAPVMYTWDPVQRRHSIGGIRSLAFSPDARLLAVGGIGKIGNIDHLEGPARVEVFEWEAGRRTHEFSADKLKGLIEYLEFQPDGDGLLGAGGANDGLLMAFDLKNNKVIRQDKAPMHIHAGAVNEAWDSVYAAGHGKIVMYGT